LRTLTGSSVKIPEEMTGVLLVGHGGFDKLEYCNDIPVPIPDPGEVLIRVAAAGINNTDINTRIGWYSKGVKSGTDAGGAQGFGTSRDADASWSGVPLSFPEFRVPIAAAVSSPSETAWTEAASVSASSCETCSAPMSTTG
jgi:hypothetical protein